MASVTEKAFLLDVEQHVDDLLDRIENLRSNLVFTEADVVEILERDGFRDLADRYKDWLDYGSQEDRDGSMNDG